jgi:hypothetical protein
MVGKGKASNQELPYSMILNKKGDYKVIFILMLSPFFKSQYTKQ